MKTIIRKNNKPCGILFCLVVLCLLLQIACAQKIWVRQEVYRPQLYNELNIYKGTEIYLAGFTNRAENTSIFYYYSPDRRFKYEGAPTVASYLWYCFQKAFKSLGMRVYEDSPPNGVSELRLTFTSLTDREFIFDTELLNNNQILHSKQFTINVPLPATRDPASLENNAYRMIDMAVSNVLMDKDFQKAFLKRTKTPQKSRSRSKK